MATQTDHLPVDETKELPSDTAGFPTTLERPGPAFADTHDAASMPAAPAAPAPDALAATPHPSPPASPSLPPPALPRPSWWALGGAVTLALLIAAVTMWWLMAQRLPDIDPQQVITRNLADAEQALNQGRYIDPPERSALHYYSTVLAVAPDNAAALAGLDTIAQRFITDARVLLADRRIAEAGVAMEKARRVRPAHPGLEPLEDQLRTELRRLVAATQSADDAAATATRPPAASQPANAIASPNIDRTTPASERRNALPLSGENVRAPNQTPTVAPAPARVETTTAQAAVARSTAGNTTDVTAADRPTARATNSPAAPPATSPDAPVSLASVPDGSVSLAAPPVAANPANNRPDAAATGSGPVIERKLIRMVQPVYPQDAAMRGLEGWVDVRMQVNADGGILRPQVVQTQGGRVFNRPALQAVQQWQYEARPGEQPQDVQVRIEFKLAQ